MFMLRACCDADRQRQRLCRLNATYTCMHALHMHAYIRERIIFSVCFRILTTAVPHFQGATAVVSAMSGGSSAGSRATDSNVRWQNFLYTALYLCGSTDQDLSINTNEKGLAAAR